MRLKHLLSFSLLALGLTGLVNCRLDGSAGGAARSEKGYQPVLPPGQQMSAQVASDPTAVLPPAAPTTDEEKAKGDETSGERTADVLDQLNRLVDKADGFYIPVKPAKLKKIFLSQIDNFKKDLTSEPKPGFLLVIDLSLRSDSNELEEALNSLLAEKSPLKGHSVGVAVFHRDQPSFDLVLTGLTDKKKKLKDAFRRAARESFDTLQKGGDKASSYGLGMAFRDLSWGDEPGDRAVILLTGPGKTKIEDEEDLTKKIEASYPHDFKILCILVKPSTSVPPANPAAATDTATTLSTD